MTKLRIEKIKDFFLRKKKEGKQLIFFEKIDKNTSREQIKENIKNYYNCEVQCDSEFSIVKVYEAATSLIGQNPLENGKTMGLSSYSKKEKFSPSRIECPTRNMSYDLRGEAHFPPRTNFPFDNSEIGPYF